MCCLLACLLAWLVVWLVDWLVGWLVTCGFDLLNCMHFTSSLCWYLVGGEEACVSQ